MSGHTPGPWLLQETTVYALNEERIPVNRFTARIDSGWRNAESRISRNEVEANAQLIAAAPDLLEALESFPGFLCGTATGDAWIEKMRAAVTKAKGQ